MSAFNLISSQLAVPALEYIVVFMLNTLWSRWFECKAYVVWNMHTKTMATLSEVRCSHHEKHLKTETTEQKKLSLLVCTLDMCLLRGKVSKANCSLNCSLLLSLTFHRTSVNWDKVSAYMVWLHYRDFCVTRRPRELVWT